RSGSFVARERYALSVPAASSFGRSFGAHPSMDLFAQFLFRGRHDSAMEQIRYGVSAGEKGIGVIRHRVLIVKRHPLNEGRNAAMVSHEEQIAGYFSAGLAAGQGLADFIDGPADLGSGEQFRVDAPL